MTSINTISRSVKYGLHYAASWPETSSILHKLSWIIVMCILQTFQYGYVIRHYKHETLVEVVDHLSICLPFTLVCAKLFVAWTHRGLLSDILSTMKEDCQKYAAIDTKSLIPKTARLSFRLTNMVLCVCVSSTAFYAIGVLAPQITNATASRELLLKMDLPFDTTKSPNYELVVAMQYICKASTAFTFGTFTGLLLMMVLHLGCQIDIMCQTLKEVPYKNKNQLRFFISRHQQIIIFADRIEKLFTYLALSQLMSNTLITCCVGYVIVIAVQTNDGFRMLIKLVVYYAAVCSEAFVYCFAGEYLNIKSKLIGDTAYEFLWYNLHSNESRLMILVILRSQRGFILTFGKFANLSMESFAGIMKASASYISVLLAMN
ncbi:Odorant receptor 4 [Anthophora retusa]